METLWPQIERLLPAVSKPARYIGGELGACEPEHGPGRVAWLLLYPDTYEIGLPNQGLQILYEILNERTDAVAERAYAPWVDMETAMRKAGLPLFSVEQQLVKALPKMAKAASNKELASGFQEHLEQTKGHAQRLEQILSSHNATTRGAKCKGMEGIVAEGAEMIEEEADEEVKDAGLIAAAQRVEHYEMAGYGTARTYAELLGDREGAKLLDTTLEEEKQTDQKLSELANSAINVAAAK